MKDEGGVVATPGRRRWPWVGAVVLLALIPLAAALGLQVLGSMVDRNHQAQLKLDGLELSTNERRAAAALSVIFPSTRATSAATRQATETAITGDLNDLVGLAGDDGRVAMLAAATQRYLGFLDLATAAPPSGVGVPASLPRAMQEYQAFAGEVQGFNAFLADRAAHYQTLERFGSTVILILAATMVGAVSWRAQVRRSREAAANAQRRLLLASEQSFRLVFDRNPLPMAVYGKQDLRFRRVNDASVRAYGYSREEFLSMSALDFYPEEMREQVESELRSDGPWPRSGERAHRTRSGRLMVVEATVDEIDFEGTPALLALARDVTDERRLRDELRHRAFHDSLTGLANRALFTDCFEKARRAAVGTERELVVVLLDIDGFKVVNDTIGHHHGDALLVQVAERLTGGVRPEDTVARMGGDEFALLLDVLDVSAAVVVVDRLLRDLSRPFQLGGLSAEITASAGMARVADPQDTWDVSIRRADVALSEAKASGKSCLRVFQPGMASPVLQRLEMAEDLRHALARGELSIHYQPLVSIGVDDGDVKEVEALARWTHPLRGVVGPDQFIPVAEETGLILPLGLWVLEAVCRRLRAWQADGTPLSASVNVSARQLQEADFVATVSRVLRETGAAPARLILEVTETALLADLEGASAKLNHLRSMGIRVALDDFGAGYSSLAYLHQLPLDVVKIDRVFVSALGSPERRPLVLSIVRLLEWLDVRIVAEGVETREQLAYVSSLGIDACQGYFFSRPVPFEALAGAIEGCRRLHEPSTLSVA